METPKGIEKEIGELQSKLSKTQTELAELKIKYENIKYELFASQRECTKLESISEKYLKIIENLSEKS